jgi:hypothetical protein
LTNLDASALWVRDRGQLIDALEVTPEFLRTKEGDAGTRGDGRVHSWFLKLTSPQASWSITETGTCHSGGVFDLLSFGSCCVALASKDFKHTYAR